MKHRPFVPAVGRIPPQEVDKLPELAAAISYWNEGACSPEEWVRRVEDFWGLAGLAIRRGEEVCGAAVFGPSDFFPRTEKFFRGTLSEDAAFLAYVGGDRRTRKHLLVRMLKEVRQRGVVGVEAISGGPENSPHVPERFLLENGWRPVRRVWHLGRAYTLMRADLGSAVEVGELARDIIGWVKLPRLKNAPPVPG